LIHAEVIQSICLLTAR